MADPQYHTTSNGARIDPERIDEFQNVLDEWSFIESQHGDRMTLKIRGEDTTFGIWGHAPFNPYPAEIDELDDPWDAMHDNVDQEGFLEAISEFLEEPLIVQTISNTKLRYPFMGHAIGVTPDGEIKRKQLNQLTFDE